MASAVGEKYHTTTRRKPKDERVLVVFQGSTYDVTDFLDKHPGGRDVLVNNSDSNVTKLMNDPTIHVHSEAAYSILKAYEVKEPLNGKRTKNTSGDNNNLSGWKEDMVDWNKPMLAQVHKLGPEYMKWVHSPVDLKLQLFESQFVEFFSKTPWYVVPIVWIPVVFYFSILSIYNLSEYFDGNYNHLQRTLSVSNVAFLTFAVCFGAGLLFWTLLEYVLHRCLFHLTPPPDSPFWITLHFFLHGQHHKVPFDSERLVFPPVAAGVFATFFYILMMKICSIGFGQGIFAGGLLGYIIYDLTHYYLHHGMPSRNSYLEDLKQYHVAHHFINQDKGFGISSKFWDYPFGTLP